jgi:hypothetical protein
LQIENPTQRNLHGTSAKRFTLELGMKIVFARMMPRKTVPAFGAGKGFLTWHDFWRKMIGVSGKSWT